MEIPRTEFYRFAEAVALHLFAPGYYDGPWYVQVLGRRKVCSNYTTAKAWADYLKRRGYTAWRHDLFIGKHVRTENN